jgi:hypothetical protein
VFPGKLETFPILTDLSPSEVVKQHMAQTEWLKPQERTVPNLGAEF